MIKILNFKEDIYALLAAERYKIEGIFGVKARILFNLGYIINDIKNKKLKRNSF